MIYAGDEHRLTELKSRVDRSVRELRPHLSEFDSIVVTGVSGLLVGPAVSLRLRVPLVVVRKQGESSHSGDRSIEGVCDIGSRYLFLDDFISGGATLSRVRMALASCWMQDARDAELAGCYMYDRKQPVAQPWESGDTLLGRLHIPYRGPAMGPVTDCPTCEGRGYVYNAAGLWGGNCDHCSGYGKVVSYS